MTPRLATHGGGRGEDASWIAGLMRENYPALGFIPEPTVAERYVAGGRFVIQRDERGRRVGYLLHGAPRAGLPLVVSQACIQYESRLRGYGEAAFAVVHERALRAGASVVVLRCAVDLPALDFWAGQGFELREIVAGGAARQREIARLFLPMASPLFEAGRSASPEGEE